MQYPEMKNNFIKQILDSEYYEKLKKDEDEIERSSFLDAFLNLFKNQEVEPQELENLESLESDI
jgi:hypothetical protein